MENKDKVNAKLFIRLKWSDFCSDFGFRRMFFFTLIVFMVNSLGLKAQDPEFSQFYANPLYLNPALTGTSAMPRFTSNYRNQWPNQGNTFVTYNFAYDGYISSIRSGLGGKVMYDRELNGVINTINSSFLYSYHVQANDLMYYSLAIEAGFISKQFNTSQLIFPGMIDQGTGTISGSYPLPFEDGQKIFPDISFGMAGQIEDVYFGVALHHLTRPDQSIIEGDKVGRLPMKMTLHVGAKGHRFHRSLYSREFTISPNLIYQQQGSFKQINAGLYLKEDWFTFGLWYRNNLSIRPDAAIAMVGIQNERFHLGYSFDFSLSELSAYSYGSHEVSMTFFFGQSSRRFYRNEMVIPQM